MCGPAFGVCSNVGDDFCFESVERDLCLLDELAEHLPGIVVWRALEDAPEFAVETGDLRVFVFWVLGHDTKLWRNRSRNWVVIGRRGEREAHVTQEFFEFVE